MRSLDMSRLCLGLSALVLVGCGAPDPCGSVTGACISARVEGTATGLDQLAIAIAGATMNSPAAPKAFTLPVVVAIVPPAGLSGVQSITVTGLGGQVERASDTQTVNLVDGKQVAVTFVLNGAGDGGAGDGGTDDLSVLDLTDPADFAGCIPVDPCTPTTFGMLSDGCGQMIDCGGPSVTDVTPRIARAGDRLVIHGRFPGAPTAVTFRGGAAGTVDASDAARLLVLMPAGALKGPIQLDFAGSTVMTPVVRRVSFPIGLQPFFPYYEQTGYGRIAQGMQVARSFHTAVAERGYLYVFGGQGAASALSSVERALINADGTLHRFVTQTATLTVARRRHAMAMVQDKVYLIGGETSGTPLASIETTTIAADHTVGAFAAAGVSLTVPRAGATTAIIGNYLYVFGGTGLRSVDRARILPDGGLGAFSDAGIQLSEPRYGASAVVIGSNLYVIGGVGNTAALASIDHASIQPDGTLSTAVAGTFDVHAQSLPLARAFHTATLVGSHLIVAGGENTGGRLDGAASAQVDTDGVLGAFVNASSSHVQPRIGHTATVIGNRLFLLGGESTALQAGFEWASLMSSATVLGAPTTLAAVSVVSQPFNYALTVSGPHVYLFASRSGVKTEHAVVGDDGLLGNFTDNLTPLAANPHDSCGAIVAGRWVYVLGGYYANATNNTYERAEINEDGTITAFATPVAGGHPSATGGFAVTTAGISGFTFGGQTTSGAQPNTYTYGYAQGTDGAFNGFSTLSNNLPAGNWGWRGATFGNNVHLVGGVGSATTYHFTFSPAGGSLAFPAVAGTALSQTRYQPSMAYVGNKLFVLGGVASSMSLNHYDTIVIGADGSFGALATSASGYFGSAGFSNNHAAVIDNYLYIFAGVEGTNGTSKVLRIPIQ